jgi:thiol-disulfide isomerase/thioredoxin/predicted small lipoprotein YifL
VNASRRIIALAAVVALGTLAACGGESGPIAAPPEDDDVTTVPSDAPGTTDPSRSPTPVTISPDLPEILVGEVGPTEVIGDPLPPHVSSPTTPIEADPAIGMEAPVIAGEDFDGSPVRINAVANGPTMVVFLAHWCSHCNAEIPEINRLRDEGRIPDGLNIVGVSTSLQPGQPNFPPSRWFEDKDWTYPVIADGVDIERSQFIATTAYGVTGFPFVTLIDGDGTVAARWSGERGADQFLGLIATYLDLT